MNRSPDDGDVSADELTRLEHSVPVPHVVILGAGASVAAFPNGDARGRRLPVMKNLIQVLGLQDLIARTGHDSHLDFETLYSTLRAADPQSPIVEQIEHCVEAYFSNLELPEHPTLYDYLLLSLRDKDAIFTFNWDPFLVDTYNRHMGSVKLPHIFHLHGNVRVAYCDHCGIATDKEQLCRTCRHPLTPTRLLYPVVEKDYDEAGFISTQWQQARDFLKRAFIITIFGYSAPSTDQAAMRIFDKAWGTEHLRLNKRVEIIDIRDVNELGSQWSPFSHYSHYDLHRSLFESLLCRYPRRSCEAWFYISFDGNFVDHQPWSGNIQGLQQSVQTLQAHEK